jgi:hypothetical protein
MLSHIQLKDIREQVRAEYSTGKTIRQVWESVNRVVPQEYIRHTVQDLIKTGRRRHQEPEIDPAEVAQRVAETKAKWTPEEARKRWVGASRDSRADLERAASRLLPD